ncbi:MAG TPA: hypothetical protein PKD12_05465 [Nitrospira sp.]|nr:hypothetical protein [Nitrospira sp.]
MQNVYPHVSDELKAHALSLVIGKYYNCAALIQRLGLDDWLAVLAVFVDCTIQNIVRSYGEELPSPFIEGEHNPDVLASQLIARWKQDRSIQERFPQFADYVDAVESMLEGQRQMERVLLP